MWFGDLTNDEVARVGAAYRRDRTFWISLRCSRAGTRSFEASKVGREEARRLYEYVLEQYHFVKIPSVRVGGAGDEKTASHSNGYWTRSKPYLLDARPVHGVLSSAPSMMRRVPWIPS